MGVCPVYAVTNQEGGVARGKLQLMDALGKKLHKEGEDYQFFLSACLLCGSCVQGCPNEVDTPRLVQSGRAHLVSQGKRKFWKSFFLRRILPSKKRLPWLLKGARASRALWASKIPKESGMRIRFLRSPKGARRRIPKIAKPFFLEREFPKRESSPGRRVSLFVGCLANYFRPQTAEGVVKALERAGCVVDVPREQMCCGLLAFGAGENDVAKKLAIQNIKAFLPEGQKPPDFITTPCASCAYMLKKHLPELLIQDPQYREAARAFSERVVPFSRLYVNLTGIQPAESKEDSKGTGPQLGSNLVRLTYHDPCHLSRGFSEKDAPRFLLQSLQGAHFVEMPHPCKCCGHGGNFNISHQDLSLAISEEKVEHVIQSGAQVVATECSGCLLQLSDAIARENREIEVITTAEAFLRYGL